MAYAEQAPNPANESLIADGARLNERLESVIDRLRKIGDTLHGAAPHDAGAAQGKIEPAPTLRRHFDGAHARLSEIDNELNRIENRL